MPSSLSHLSYFSTFENVLLSGSHMKSVTFILTAGLQSEIEICCVRAMARNWQGDCLLLPIPLPCPWQAENVCEGCRLAAAWLRFLLWSLQTRALCLCVRESEGKRSPWDNTPKRLYLFGYYLGIILQRGSERAGGNVGEQKGRQLGAGDRLAMLR